MFKVYLIFIINIEFIFNKNSHKVKGSFYLFQELNIALLYNSTNGTFFLITTYSTMYKPILYNKYLFSQPIFLNTKSSSDYLILSEIKLYKIR